MDPSEDTPVDPPCEQSLGPETGGASGSAVVSDVVLDILSRPLTHLFGERARSASVLNRVAHNLRHGQGSSIPYPSVDRPVNDFNCSGLLTKAFPCLFPYGSGDVSCRDRPYFISETEAAKHYSRYCVDLVSIRALFASNPRIPLSSLDAIHNGSATMPRYFYPFVSHERFMHWMQNLCERHRAIRQRNFWLGKNEDFANLTNEDLLGIINDRGEEYNQLLGSMQSYNANINGSPQYLFQKRRLLESVIDQCGMPTFWFTLSMADNHWHDLHQLIHRDSNGRSIPFPTFSDVQSMASWKRKVVRENPHIVDEYFQKRVKALFATCFGKRGLSLSWLWYRIEYQCRGAPHAHGCAQLECDPGLTKLASTVVKGRIAHRMLESCGEIVPDDVIPSSHDVSLDEWVDREVSDLLPIAGTESEELRDHMKEGDEAHQKIINFVDYVFSAHHPDPPSDSTSDTRDESTKYHPRTSTSAHPSAMDVKSILNDCNELNALFCRSLDVQYRHCHQKYCDRNFDRRERARVAEANGTLGRRAQKSSEIPVDCRFSFPQPIWSNSHVFVKETKTRNNTFRYRAYFAFERNDKWLNSCIPGVAEVWGANTDFQPVLDPGMVIDYMTKYVTKSELQHSSSMHRLFKSVFSDVVGRDGKSARSCLRKMMSKLLGDRMMSKQEKCHLVNGSPIVECTHRMINVDLRNENCAIDVANVPQVSAESPNGHPTANLTSATVPAVTQDSTRLDESSESDDDGTDGAKLKRMTLIEAYAKRVDHTIWHCERAYRKFDKTEETSLREFCRLYYVNQSNSIALRSSCKVVVNFFPTYSYNEASPMYPEYCKYSLMVYKPWQNNPSTVWGGANATNQTVILKWKAFVSTLGEDIPDLLA